MKIYVVVEVSPDEQDFIISCRDTKDAAERFLEAYKKDRPNADWTKRVLKVVEFQKSASIDTL